MLRIAKEPWRTESETAIWRNRFATLTRRQREGMELIVAGKLNKQVAGDLGTGEQNVKLHRARITRKMGVVSLVDLIRSSPE